MADGISSNLDYLKAHVEALFLHNEQGRLVAVNDVDQGAAPRLYLGRTVEGNVWRLRHDLAPDLAEELEETLADEPVASDLERPAVTAEWLREVLERDAPIHSVWEGPAWNFPRDVATPSDIEVERVTAGMEFSGDRFTWLADELEVSEPVFVVLDGNRIVSLCHSSRNAAHAAEAGVETLEGYRGRGYAAAVVAHWAREVRAEGREPLYSTSWDNVASRALARSLGLILYGADLHMP